MRAILSLSTCFDREICDLIFWRDTERHRSAFSFEKLPFAAISPSYRPFINRIPWSVELHASSFTSTPMASSRLPNYLRAYRKRQALSQRDMAFLLGVKDGAKVCRHEKFTRTPSLETALAYEAIFKKPVSELFAGLYQKIERQVAERAKILNERPKRGKVPP